MQFARLFRSSFAVIWKRLLSLERDVTVLFVQFTPPVHMLILHHSADQWMYLAAFCHLLLAYMLNVKLKWVLPSKLLVK